MSNPPDRRDLELEIAALRERLSRLSQASLRITQDLDFNLVLQGALDSACSLTNARYGVIVLHDGAGVAAEFLSSGMTPEETERLWTAPGWDSHFQYLAALPGPLRVPDLPGLLREMGLPDLQPPVELSERVSFLAFPVDHQGERVGSIYLAEKQDGEEFSQEDEDTLALFAAQAALAIANARQHREERRARADLETLVDTSPVGVVVFDAGTGLPLSFNREALRIVDGLRDPQQSPVDLLNAVTFRRADGREFSLREFPLAGLLGAGETVRAEEIALRVPDGRSVTVLLNSTPIMGEHGGVDSVVVTAQDLAPLEDAERLRADFLAMVSHELLAPLTSIKGSAATLLGSATDMDPSLARQFFRIIDDQADHMKELVSDLLDVAQIETGALPVSPEPAEVSLLVDRARSAFSSAGGQHPLELDVAADLPLVAADRRRIVQVLVNLLTNAARHSLPDSVIRVSAVRDGVHVAVSVADEGRGIPSERLPHLFRKFSGADAREHGGNTGLGLAICKGIVEAHGGRIRAESDGVGLGALFTFTLPTAGGSRRQRRDVSGFHRVIPPRAGGPGGSGAGAGGGRRPPGAALHLGCPFPGGLFAPSYRRPPGGVAADGGGAAPTGPAGPYAARRRRRGPDAGHPEGRGCARHLHLGLRAGGPGGPGLRHGGGGLRGQALLTHGAFGPDPGCSAPEGGARAPGTLRASRPGG